MDALGGLTRFRQKTVFGGFALRTERIPEIKQLGAPHLAVFEMWVSGSWQDSGDQTTPRVGLDAPPLRSLFHGTPHGLSHRPGTRHRNHRPAHAQGTWRSVRGRLNGFGTRVPH